MPPAGRPRLVDRHGVAAPAQVIGGGQPRGAGTDDEDALARRRGVDGDGPALLDRLVAEEALDRVDADRLVEVRAVAGRFARVVTHATHHGRQRVVGHDLPPGGLVVAAFGVVEPLLAVLAGGAAVVARRQAVDVARHLGAPRAGLVGEAGADVERDGEGLVHQSNPNRSMLRSARACTCAMTSSRRSGEKRWAKRFCGSSSPRQGPACGSW